ncbi:hypothetical protein CRUP_004135 [Coryphaenoides rupestris]|nr:hypothetical protein CRUP_004135 [Coryphaenoides rupestris]
MEKDLEKVKEDLEKVSEILRSGTCEGDLAEVVAKASRMAEEWILLSDRKDEGVGPPKTESKGVTARAEGDPWNAMREDDAAFAARVKEEEQKIFNLMVERSSQQATPDTPPARTPTEESSPAMIAHSCVVVFAVDPQDEAERKEQRLAIIADHLGFSWTELARELDFNEERINQIRMENPNSLQDQSHALLNLWKKKEGKHATDTTLLRSLTKINRMDIVHIIKTKINKSNQEDTMSHTYAEIERTIATDHSEGFSALHEDIDSPRTCRRTTDLARHPVSGQQAPVVSAEKLSSSLSSLGDLTGRLETDTSATLHLKQAQKLQKETEKTQ